VAAKRIVRVPQPRYLLAIKGTPPARWRGKPGSPFLRPPSFGDTKEGGQLSVCHRQW